MLRRAQNAFFPCSPSCSLRRPPLARNLVATTNAAHPQSANRSLKRTKSKSVRTIIWWAGRRHWLTSGAPVPLTTSLKRLKMAKHSSNSQLVPMYHLYSRAWPQRRRKGERSKVLASRTQKGSHLRGPNHGYRPKNFNMSVKHISRARRCVGLPRLHP